MPLVTDYTSLDYNSYYDLNEMNDKVLSLDGYYDISLWENIEDDQIKENLILQATKNLNSFNFVGVVNRSVVSPFNMKWPRTGVYYTNGVSVAGNEIPSFIGDYLSQRIVELQSQQRDGSFYDGRIKRQKVGDLEQEFQNPRDSKLLSNNLKSNDSFDCIRDYVLNSSKNMRWLTRA